MALYKIRICKGARCRSNFSDDLFTLAEDLLKNNSLIELEGRSCMGMCQVAPNLELIDLASQKIIEVKHQVDFNSLKIFIDSLVKRCES